MSDPYTKLFSSITESTIWSEPAGTRLVWITMLAKANRHGEVFGSVPGLARLANVTLDECATALETLKAPDPWSRTPDNEGRRIEDIPGGWRLINHAKYDRLRSEAEAAERERERKREWDRQHRPSGHQRARQSDDSPTVRQQSVVSPSESVPPPTPTPTPDRKAKSIGASPTGDAPASADPIPYQEIVGAYNLTLTGLARVREVTPKRRTLIRSAWQASPQRRSLDFWTAYFAECQDDPFLNGTGPYGKGHENWRPDFDYLLRADVVTRTFERALDRVEREA